MKSARNIAESVRFRSDRFVLRFLLFLLPSIGLPLYVILLTSQPSVAGTAVAVMLAGVGASLMYLNRQITALSTKADSSEKMLDEIPCYAFLLDGDLRIIWSNRLFNEDFNPARNQWCFQVFRGLDEPCSDCTARECFHDGRIHGAERAVSQSDGNIINLMFYSAPLRDSDGKILAVLEIAVNITSVKELQKRLALVGTAVAGMAHSIKNIMMGLDGGIYIVNKGLETNDQQEIKEGWDVVQFNFEKIQQIVQDILYCSKEREPNFQPVDPNSILTEIHDLFRDTARSYAIELRMEPDSRLSEAVIDPQGLHTVLSNLVSNAIDACKVDLWKDEHTVVLRSRLGTDGSTVVEVTDNGVGLDSEVKEHAFEDFFTSKGNQGTGLGLMVSQKIMEEHGGQITFDSRYGQGTTFTAVFPPREPERPEDESQKVDQAG